MIKSWHYKCTACTTHKFNLEKPLKTSFETVPKLTKLVFILEKTFFFEDSTLTTLLYFQGFGL